MRDHKSKIQKLEAYEIVIIGYCGFFTFWMMALALLDALAN